MVRVSIIVLNYNGTRFLEKLFNSLSRQTFGDLEIVFVDNSSTDGSVRLLKRILKERNMKRLHVRIIKNDVNLGYCGGNNVGLERARGEYVVFLNNDTYVSETWLEELVKVMDAHHSIGACQSRLIKPKTGEVLIDGFLLDLYGWPRGIIFDKSGIALLRALFYASGASMIVRRATLSSIGGFDSQLFFGDFDLCWRLRLVGYEICSALRSLCYHYGSETTKAFVPPPVLTYHQDREIIRVLVKCYSIPNLLKRLPVSMAIMTVQSIACILKYRKPSYITSFIKSLIWNLAQLRKTLDARAIIQRLRNTPDSTIERCMQSFPALLRKNGILRIS